MLDTPILFLVFNRPDLTARTFELIREAKPKRLFVAADGPRDGVVDERLRCEETRKVASAVDWDCDVQTLFRERNLGCRDAVHSAIEWYFDHVDRGIILEDDCLPDPTFFRYCEGLLDRYRDDERVMAITGQNLQFGQRRGNASYYFSCFAHIWGWASWRRAWRLNSPAMHHEYLDAIRDSGLLRGYFGEYAESVWIDTFTQVLEGKINTWDYPWMLTCWAQNGLTATANVNMVSNIGFDGRGTHTQLRNQMAEIPRSPIGQLTHPTCVLRDATADRFVNDEVLKVVPAPKRTITRRIEGRLRGMMTRFWPSDGPKH
ncbi:MAG: hypothetical protein RI963_1617 [Planctomycetota bacterium]|jgi:hypothetical protein